MKTKNYFSYCNDEYMYDNYFNDIFEMEDNTIVFENNRIIYSDSENINSFVNHPYRKAFDTQDFVQGIKKGIIKDTKYVNFIFDMNKNYTFVENEEVYQLSFCNIEDDIYLAYFKVPETCLIQRLNRDELEKSLMYKMRVVGDTFSHIEIPKEKEILNKIKEQKSLILNFAQGLCNTSDLGMPLVDYELTDKITKRGSKDHNYKFLDDVLCIDRKCNFYKISVTYLGPDDYKLEYKYMTIKDLDLDRLFDGELAIDRRTQKKLLK